MKKVIALCLTLVLTMAFMAVAHAEYGDEILFRGLPWGASVTYVAPLYPNFDQNLPTYAATSINKLAISCSMTLTQLQIRKARCTSGCLWTAAGFDSHARRLKK